MITKYCNVLAQNTLGLGTDTTYKTLITVAENIKLKCISIKGSTLRNKVFKLSKYFAKTMNETKLAA